MSKPHPSAAADGEAGGYLGMLISPFRFRRGRKALRKIEGGLGNHSGEVLDLAKPQPAWITVLSVNLEL